MDHLAPSGKVFNAGTFNAHPISMVAGLATIEVLEREPVYEIANRAAEEVSAYMEKELGERGVEVSVNRLASMFQVFFVAGGVTNPSQASKADRKMYIRFHEALLREGVFIPPSQFETCFTSYSHSDEVVAETQDAIRRALRSL